MNEYDGANDGGGCGGGDDNDDNPMGFVYRSLL
jgi:hypothetical protein